MHRVESVGSYPMDKHALKRSLFNLYPQNLLNY